MNGPPELYNILNDLKISFEYYEHPPVYSVKEAIPFWEKIKGTRCKNIFFRNHKGNRHYLIILEHKQDLIIRDLEQRLKQGKLTFASEKRLDKYLGLKPGSVTPFGLINDHENHVYLFIDKRLAAADKVGFHPNMNTATLVISLEDFITFLDWSGNGYEFLELY
jgi:Ala-tRNA(Pro) deacylase